MNEVKNSDDFEVLLEYLKKTRGFDFKAYKRSSLARRVDRRMQIANVASYREYVDFLETRPAEFSALFNIILINVTSFFRDPQSWEYLRKEIVPDILSRKSADQPIRVWSAGCASGQEAYTLAMLLAELLGLPQALERVKIYATDADEEALAEARHAVYQARQVEGVPAPFLEKYFDCSANQYTFHKELRRMVIFGRHDLVQDAPISRIDLLVCRNTLMYFNAEAQSRIVSRFHFALNDGAYLFLGKAETLLTHAKSFSAIDLKTRIFKKVGRDSIRDRMLLMAQATHGATNAPVSDQTRLRDAALDSSPIAHVTIDRAGKLIEINQQARSVFGLISTDQGRQLSDLEISYRPVELRSLLEQVYAERRTIAVREVEWPTTGGEIRCLDVEVAALTDGSGSLLGAGISFIDVSLNRKLRAELQHANQELETTLEELQSTNEELETTNEELQSTVEELETTNEELQSTNEELETMNEELQSTNEELQTINDEGRQRSEDLNQINDFMNSILTGLRDGVIVVDQDLRILAWNSKAENLWGLRREEVMGKHLMNLDIGLPLDQFRTAIRNCLNGGSELEQITIDATNRRGRKISCHVSLTPLKSGSEEKTQIRGAIFVMDGQDLAEL